MQLSIERRRDLGNWCDVVSEADGVRVTEPMAVRYSETRLEATATVKRLCLAAVVHLAKHSGQKGQGAEWDRLQGCIRSLDSLERYTLHHTWGR